MTDRAPDYRPRLVDSTLADAFTAFAAVMLTGPRAVGKTTTAARLASQVDRLDIPDVASAYRADPDAALQRAQRPLLIDEWQEVPEVLAAVKRAVDRDRTPGQFLLTGSVRATADLSSWAGTGRVVRVSMHPLTEREVAGDPGSVSFVAAVARDWMQAIPNELPAVDIDAYLRLMLRGGFPQLAFEARTDAQRRLWLDGYLDDLASRDVESVGAQRDPVRLRRYLAVLGLNLAGVLPEESLVRQAGVNVRTAVAYDNALMNLEILDHAPAWASSRVQRMTRMPKRYLTDTALAAAAADLEFADILNDSGLRGRWFDGFAAMQLRAELAAAVPRRALHHVRFNGGRHEVDVLIELGRGRVFAFEIKAGTAPTRHDARHLMWLRDELGKNFLGGLILHTGQAVVELDDRVGAAPISALWAR